MNIVDRVALIWAAFVVFVFMFVFSETGPRFYAEHLTDPDYVTEWLKLLLYLVGIPWLLLRLVFMSARRRRGVIYRPLD